MNKRLAILNMESWTQDALTKSGYSWPDLDFEVACGFSKNKTHIWRDPDHRQNEYYETIQYEGNTPPKTLTQLTAEERIIFETLTLDEQRDLLFYRGANYMWDHILTLTENGRWDMKAKESCFNQIAHSHFNKLINFCSFLPFSNIGRVIILGISPNQKVYKHCDTDKDEKICDMILLTFQVNSMCKKIFVINEKNQEVQLPVRGACLDDSFVHHIPASPFFTYSVRIDGVFLPEVRESIS